MDKDAYVTVETPTSVYVMQWQNKVKIGISRDPSARLRQLQLANPGEVRLIHTRVFSTRPGAIKVERSLHKRFADHRLLGEWFSIPAERAIKWVERAKDPEIHHKDWHPEMPAEIGAAGVFARWKWRRDRRRAAEAA